MKLNKLTNLEQDTILNDYSDAISSIKDYLNILSKPEELNNLMIKELLEIRDIYGQERKSRISQDEGLLNKEDMIKKEDVIVVLTDANYVKRMPVTEFRSQKRGGRGVNAANFKEGDKVAYAAAPIGSYSSHRIYPTKNLVKVPDGIDPVSYTHLRAHETPEQLV